MDGLIYSLEHEPTYSYSDTDKAPLFDFKVSIYDSEDYQVIKVITYYPFVYKNKNSVSKGVFSYNVPYGQNKIDLENILDKLVYHSFNLQLQNLPKTTKPADLPTLDYIREMRNDM